MHRFLHPSKSLPSPIPTPHLLIYNFFMWIFLATFLLPPSTWLTPNNAISSNLLGFPGGSDGKESAYNVGDLGSIPGLGRYTGEGNSYPLHYSGLENSKVRGDWWAIVHGVAKSQTRLGNFHLNYFTIKLLFASFPQTKVVQSVYQELSNETEKQNHKTQELALEFLPSPVFCVDASKLQKTLLLSWIPSICDSPPVGGEALGSINCLCLHFFPKGLCT